MRSRSNSGVKLDNYVRMVHQTILRHQVGLKCCFHFSTGDGDLVVCFVFGPVLTLFSMFFRTWRELLLRKIAALTQTDQTAHTAHALPN